MFLNYGSDEDDVMQFQRFIDLIVYLNSMKPHEREEDKALAVHEIKNAYKNDDLISAEEALELVLYFVC